MVESREPNMPSAIPAAPPLPTALPPSPLMKRSVNVVADPIDGGDVGREKRQRAAKAAAAAEGYGGVPSDDDDEEFTPEKRLRESDPTKSRYRGVKYAGGKYIATIQKGGAANREHIGCFDAEEDAARAYDARARFFGEEAWCNFPDDASPPPVPTTAAQSSRYRGVAKFRDKWQVHITHAGTRDNLGTFDDEVAAARAYDRRARQLGEHGKCNFPDDDDDDDERRAPLWDPKAEEPAEALLLLALAAAASDARDGPAPPAPRATPGRELALAPTIRGAEYPEHRNKAHAMAGLANYIVAKGGARDLVADWGVAKNNRGDTIFIDPVSGRIFRSKPEVARFLGFQGKGKGGKQKAEVPPAAFPPRADPAGDYYYSD